MRTFQQKEAFIVCIVCVRHANYFSGPVILASYSHGMAGSKSGRDELDNRVMHLGLGYVFVSRHPTST